MDSLKLASGDSHNSSLFIEEGEGSENHINIATVKTSTDGNSVAGELITPELIENNEMHLKERIIQCRNIIESLKHELSKEKSKLVKETKSIQQPSVSHYDAMGHESANPASILLGDFYSSNIYSSFVDSKLNCDENVVEYEKQLQKYQNTLNMAQIEKKNAIRKQMLAKAYKLKLLEVENQCNIELLRVKQSIQCLEPLQMIANKWKTGSISESTYDLNNYELIPRFPELNASSGSDINSYRDDYEVKSLPDKSKIYATEDSTSDKSQKIMNLL